MCDLTASDCPRHKVNCDGFVYDEETNTAKECKTRRLHITRLEAEKNLKSARITPKFLTRTLDNYQPQNASQKAALSTCRAYVANFATSTWEGVGFLGPVGTGKTHLMAGLVNALMGKGVECLYASMADIAGELVGSVAKQETEELIDKLCAVRFLALDDIGVEKDSEFITTARYRIINTRNEGLLPTCFTTNLTQDELARRYGDRVESRLSEMARWLIVTGSDYRKRG